MQWILQYSELISALTGIGTLLVWVIYLQVFISSYRRQLRATLLITRGAGDGFDARCFLSNMSSGPVYVQSVIISLEAGDETIVCPATDIEGSESELPSDPRQRTRQGPIGSGEIRDIGSFGHLIHHALRHKDEEWHTETPETKTRAIIIEILGVYGSEDLPVGARRRFISIQKDGRALRERTWRRSRSGEDTSERS